ncbi:MAG: PKD domain-containing protein [Anaerolineae bacterium]
MTSTGAAAHRLRGYHDNFSVRWSRWWSSNEGTYRFHVVDDGVRLYVDDALVIDNWQDGGWREVVGERWLGAGNHTLRIEYYEHSGDAVIKAWAEKVTVSAAPDADFDAEHRSGNVPLHVEFDNDSDGNYDRCEWEFGDDHDSDDCDGPHHTYKEAGQYTVRLKIWGPGGSDSKKREDYVTVRPVAQFDASPKSGPKPLTVSFINQSTSHDLSEWDFGDGQTSTQHDPTHTYTVAGVYAVRLRVKEAGIWSDYQTKPNFITVTELPPVAAFTATPTSGPATLNVQFTDHSSGVITAWLWDFGDGTSGSALQSPTHTYATAGVYNVSLTVSGPGGSDTETKPNYITVSPEPPEAKFVATPTIGVAPLTVAFTDHSLGAITGWLWDFGDGTPGSTEQNPTHIYAANGEYTVSLTVNGPAGSDTETRPGYIVVTEKMPIVKFRAEPTTGPAPLTVNFIDDSLPKGSITTWQWSFGDGASSTEPNPTHIYTEPGNYTVSLTVSDTDGRSDTLTRSGLISVSATPSPAPVQADFSGTPTNGQAPLTVNFTNLSNGDYDTCTWDFGWDGATSNDCGNPSFTYQQAGLYTVSLAVSGPGGNDIENKTDYITVPEPSPPPTSARTPVPNPRAADPNPDP